MSKSLWHVNEEIKDHYNTRDNDYDMFPVGTLVKIICKCQDFNFFFEETGKVIRNRYNYLGIIVEFDNPRVFKDDSTQESFNFAPDDLIVIGQHIERPRSEVNASKARTQRY